MSSTAPSSAPPPLTPHSVFISYASGDRAAARLLNDHLAAAGLDVWLDEEELAGGEAWDAKIRKQIRTCTYFMPLISATTEARREGYFRREWRLAVERTLDLADDVLFLVPVVIDETREQGARVPEKFTTVQWLRCPGGKPTAALTSLARRLADEGRASEPTVPAPEPAKPPSRAEKRAARAAEESARVPFPKFPPYPAAGHFWRFLYDLVVWAGHMIHALWVRLPKTVRAVAAIVIVFRVIGVVFESRQIHYDEKPAAKVTEKLEGAIRPVPPAAPDISKSLLEAAGVALSGLQGGRPLAVATFTATDAAVSEAASHALTGIYRQLSDGNREKQVGVSLGAIEPNASDVVMLARATTAHCRWLLTGTARPEENDSFTLDLRLFDAEAEKVIWSASRSGPRASAESIGAGLAPDVLAQVNFDPAKAE